MWVTITLGVLTRLEYSERVEVLLEACKKARVYAQEHYNHDMVRYFEQAIAKAEGR